jgi:hypothetical protein
MNKMLIDLCLVAVLLISCEGPRAKTEAELAKQAAFPGKVLALVPGVSKSASLTFEKVDESKEINVKVEFQKPVPSYVAEIGGKLVAQAVVDTLMADGYNPKTLNTYIFVWVQARTTGATGGAMFIPYGSAIYHPVNDQIVFESK